jgi:hypothetical protein
LGFWDRLGDWQEDIGFLGCPFLNTLVEVHDPGEPARAEVVSFIGEVESFFATTARAAGLPRSGELGHVLRVITMGALMAVRMERSRAPIDVGRATAFDLLASWTGATRHEMRQRFRREPR